MFRSTRVFHSLGRRVVNTGLKTAPQKLGAIRLSSYFTPGKQHRDAQPRRSFFTFTPCSF